MEQQLRPQMEWFMNPRPCPIPPPAIPPADMEKIILAFTDYYQGCESIMQEFNIEELTKQYEKIRSKLLKEIEKLLPES